MPVTPSTRMHVLKPIVVLLGLILQVRRVSGHAEGCTTIVVGAKATVDGSAIVTHSNDGPTGDFRVAYVPAKDHAPGAMRPLFRAEGMWMMYPRSTDSERSSTYRPVADAVHEQEIIGYVPQVQHTFALWESGYGLMNEHGLALGESTCSGKLVGVGKPYGGSALFTVANLMALALERCKTAICAIETMGNLAETYGFYGEDQGISGAGETVTLADATGDAWVFHVTGGVANRSGALWVAQRVPDSHVAVVANSFSIKEVDLQDKHNFRGSQQLLELAQAAGVWDGKGRFNWQASLSPDYDVNWEAELNAYDPLRMWRVFTMADPGLGLKPSNRLSDVPFSVAPSVKVSNLMVMDWHRDTYDGTEFDMKLGALAGPWQSPRRPSGSTSVEGQWARSISMHWSLYCIVAQPSLKHPVLWFAADSAKSTVFVPFFAEVLGAGNGRYSQQYYGEGSQFSFSLAPGSPRPAWWAFNFVANWLELSYKNMSQQYVFPKVRELQEHVVHEVEKGMSDADSKGMVHPAELLGNLQVKLQEHVATEWWALADMLIVRYNDQFFNFPPHSPSSVATIGFPAFWFEMAGFNSRSYYPGWFQASNQPPSLLPADEFALAKESMHLASACGAVGSDKTCEKPRLSLLATIGNLSSRVLDSVGVVAFGIACGVAGFWAGSRRHQRRYESIDKEGYLRIGA